MQGVAGFEDDGWEEEEEEGLWGKFLVEGEVLVGDQREDGVVENAHYEA